MGLSMKVGLAFIPLFLIVHSADSQDKQWGSILESADKLVQQHKVDSAIALTMTVLSNNSSDLPGETRAEICHRLGDWYLRIAREDSSMSYYEKAMNLRLDLLGRDHRETKRSRAGYLTAGGRIRMHQRQFASALEFLSESQELRLVAYGPTHPETGRGYGHLGALLHVMGDYSQAEQQYRLAINTLSRGGKEGAVFLGRVTGDLGDLMWDLGRYVEADEFFDKSIDYFIELDGNQSELVVNQLINISWLYEEVGRFSDCEEILNRVLIINEQKYPPDDFRIGLSYERFGWLYINQEHLEEAERCTRRAVEIFEKSDVLGESRLPLGLVNLGILAQSGGRMEEAEEFYRRGEEKARPYREASTPEAEWVMHSLGLQFMGNVGFLSARKPERAVPYLEAVASYWKKVGGDNHPHRLQAVRELGLTYSRLGRYAVADSLFEIVEEGYLKVLGDRHPYLAETYDVWSRNKRANKRYREAIEKAREAIRIRKRNFDDTRVILSERDALSNARLLQQSSAHLLSAFLDGFEEVADLAPEVADVVIATKGVVSETVRKRLPETDRELHRLSSQERVVKERIARLHVTGPRDNDPDGYRDELDSLARLADEIERDLLRRGLMDTDGKQGTTATAGEIVRLLPSGSALVEFTEYQYLELPSEKKRSKLAAIVLRKDGSPSVVDLGLTSEITEQIRKYREYMGGIAAVSPGSSRGLPEEYEALSGKVVELLWKPIARKLGGREATIMIAPDGDLSLIPFGGLLDNDGVYLIEKVAFHYLSAARDLLGLRKEEREGQGMLVLGDPDYNASPGSRAIAHDLTGPEDVARAGNSGTLRNIRSGCGNLADILVDRLSGTREEAETVAGLFSESYANETVSIGLGVNASEEMFKAMGGGKRVIHLATHGFFFTDECNGPRESASAFARENPLLQSGLLLSGSNLHGAGSEESGSEDGILTALEVSAMDFRGTDIVVLSACETGLGEVKQGEGVYGLRRAFQLAGARTVVSSLWQVPDDEAMKFMKQLYSNEAGTYPELMQKVALQKLNELRARKRPTHPFTWGAFIATGDWRRR